jgi:hypothetical protein
MLPTSLSEIVRDAVATVDSSTALFTLTFIVTVRLAVELSAAAHRCIGIRIDCALRTAR